VVSLVHERVGVQSRVVHDSVDEVVHHGSDVIDTTESVVERGLFY